MKKTSKYFFSVLAICLVTSSVFSQTTYRTKGLRLGMDISRFSIYYFDPERVAYEFSADFEIRKDLYLTAEYGLQTVTLDKDIFEYHSEGDYFRIGLDRNFLKSENPDDYDMVFAGIRYGYSKLSHSSDSISTPENYWGFITNYSIPEYDYSAHWIEIAAGIRTELFRNFFIGWSLRARVMVAHTKDPYMVPYNIPGYGDGSKKGVLGFNFSMYYLIPLYKQEVNYKTIKK